LTPSLSHQFSTSGRSSAWTSAGAQTSKKSACGACGACACVCVPYGDDGGIKLTVLRARNSVVVRDDAIGGLLLLGPDLVEAGAGDGGDGRRGGGRESGEDGGGLHHCSGGIRVVLERLVKCDVSSLSSGIQLHSTTVHARCTQQSKHCGAKGWRRHLLHDANVTSTASCCVGGLPTHVGLR
jgi:hypothetical protein